MEQKQSMRCVLLTTAVYWSLSDTSIRISASLSVQLGDRMGWSIQKSITRATGSFAGGAAQYENGF